MLPFIAESCESEDSTSQIPTTAVGICMPGHGYQRARALCHSLAEPVPQMPRTAHARKSFPNLIESNPNQIVFTIFRLICKQANVRLIPKSIRKW